MPDASAVSITVKRNQSWRHLQCKGEAWICPLYMGLPSSAELTKKLIPEAPLYLSAMLKHMHRVGVKLRGILLVVLPEQS